MSTEVIPVEPTEPAAPPAEAKRRRRWPIVVAIVVGALIVLGVVAFFVAEAVAKNYAREYVRDQVVAALKLPDDAEVDVDLGGGSIILQALAGRVDRVDVDVPTVTFGALTGGLQLRGEGVPLDANAPVESLAINFVVGSDDLAALAESSDSSAPEFEFADGEIRMSSEISLFGASLALALSLEPSAVDGDLMLTPTSVTLGDQTFEAGDDDGSFIGQIIAALFQPQKLCIANGVPQALVLTDASIDETDLVLGFTGDGAAFAGPEMSTLGTCPAA